MKVGLSMYSLYQSIRNGEMTPMEAVQWISDNGGEIVEIPSFITNFHENQSLIGDIVEIASKNKIQICSYCLPANVIVETKEEYEKEIIRIFSEIDIANKLGAKIMRTDLVSWGRPYSKSTIENFEKDLPVLIDACRRISDYAKQYDITMTVENHGTYINGGDRIRRIIVAVDRENFKCTLDVGNSLCVDEDPFVCVQKLIPYAAIIHFKDFYIRRNSLPFDTDAWITTNYGTYLRGAIIGHGDVDVIGIMKKIQDYGYDGNISIEFEGLEDCRLGSKLSLDNVKRYINL